MNETTDKNQPQSLLNGIDSPADLRQLSHEQLLQVAEELRQTILCSLNQSGGHFAGNLGTIELAVALHAVYNTPYDRLVWDVGHQAYPHKVLTGRREQLPTIKQPGGLAPFPSRDESEYDTFGVGHSSTSISAAVGMAIAAKLKAEQRHSVAVIGDGGMTAGMAFEALNHAGAIDDLDLLVVLNDNEMSISPNVGALSNYFARILTSKVYSSVRSGGKRLFNRIPSIKSLLRRTEVHMKGMLVPGTLFEELGFNYIGPIDGHDLPLLIKTLNNLKDIQEPRLLHIVTRKGKGYAPAEADPVKYHAVKPGFLDTKTGPNHSNKTAPSYSDVFGRWLCDMAAVDENCVAITPAMREGSGMVAFSEQFPDRYFDVGIAEQHSVTFAAGLACEGLKPVVAIYSTFLQRAYDQMIHDVCLQDLDVLFAIDRAGIVGSDGPTHAGSFDISFSRCIPNMILMAPSDELECRRLLTTGYHYPGPAAVRYPRGNGIGLAMESSLDALPIGKACLRRQGQGVVICAFGPLLANALIAAEKLNATVIDMRFIKPLDENMLLAAAREHELLVTLEDNAVMAGAGSAVNECLLHHEIGISILNLGLPDAFLAHGEIPEMHRACGLDSDSIIAKISQHTRLKQPQKAPAVTGSNTV